MMLLLAVLLVAMCSSGVEGAAQYLRGRGRGRSCSAAPAPDPCPRSTLQAAFDAARADAAREHGTGPYAGTVYSKTEVELFDEPPRSQREASTRASELMRIHGYDTSSPAGALPMVTEGSNLAWLLFGRVVT